MGSGSSSETTVKADFLSVGGERKLGEGGESHPPCPIHFALTPVRKTRNVTRIYRRETLTSQASVDPTVKTLTAKPVLFS